MKKGKTKPEFYEEIAPCGCGKIGFVLKGEDFTCDDCQKGIDAVRAENKFLAQSLQIIHKSPNATADDLRLYASDALSMLDEKVAETNNAEIEGSARECGKCAELEAENGKLQKRIEFIKEVRSCDIHKTERSWVGWGCPDCMRELRQRNAELERENKAHTDLIKFFRNNMCIADTADYDFIRKEFQLWIDRANDQWEVERDLIECTMGAERYAKFTAELEKENETLRRNKDVDYGFYIPPTNSDEILRSAEIYERVEKLVRENTELENRVASFQRAQSLIVGELLSKCDGSLIEKVNKWVNGEDAEIEPNAVIIKRSGEIRNIQFVCFTCYRVSIFTNEFIDAPEFEKLMQCPECLDTRFHVRSFDTTDDD